MTRKPKIGIVGAGLGGLVAANALLRRGYDIDVFEQAPQLGEFGAGIQVSPNTVKVLRALGLEAELLKVAHEPHFFLGRDWQSGRQVYRSPIKDVFPARYGAGYYHVHRADLHRVLGGGLPEEKVHLSARCVELINGKDAMGLRFADGRQEEYDAVIGADGIRSVVREALFGSQQPQFTGCMCWRALVDAEKLHPGVVLPAITVWLGPSAHVVHYYVRGRKLVNFVAVFETDQWVEESWNLPSSREELLAAYRGWHPDLLALFGQAEQIYKWGLFDRDPLPRWSVGRATILGDAAHPMLPFFAQGAGQAIEDGYVVAASLAALPEDIPAALQHYEALRRERTTRVQLGSRERRHALHLRSPWARFKRNLAYKWQEWRDPVANSYKAGWIYELDVTDEAAGQAAVARPAQTAVSRS
ncbi:MAG: salicylate 1-monooxygenase [Betaproteobacteria bacterium]|nr:salicylate 1-monooxygenase [Betaproteobacteria bacterium]